MSSVTAADTATVDTATVDTVIVGAGHAGVQLATSLREQGYAGTISLISEEGGEPYSRPPLSKDHLAAGASADALPLSPKGQLAAQNVDLVSGAAVTALDPDAHTLDLSDGRRIAWKQLALATGAAFRPLDVPGSDLAGVHYLRTLEQADSLRDALTTATRVVIVGAGFIALEFAAVARDRGLPVTLIATSARLLARSVSPVLADYLANFHRERGVEFVLDSGIASLEGSDGPVATVVDTAGTRHPADLVVVGIGADPRTELAERAGLTVSNGIVVDGDLRTSHPDIVAIGDCARPEGEVRLESVQNAVSQAQRAAVVLAAGGHGGSPDVPWFWSHQGGLSLQMAGLWNEADEFVVPGDPATGKFSIFGFRAGELVVVESVNRAADHISARRVLAGRGAEITPDVVREPGFLLKTWLAEHPAEG